MLSARAKDWVIGAVTMLLALTVGLLALWWSVSDPADGSDATRSAPSGNAVPTPQGPPKGLRNDEVWFADLVLGTDSVVAAGSHLRDVRAVGRDVTTRGDGLVAGWVSVQATVPFDVVERELGGETRIAAAGDGQATVTRNVEVLGRQRSVSATGTVDVVGGRLVLEPRSIDLGGPAFLSAAVATVVRQLLTIDYAIEGLPDGLDLRDVVVRADGFRATLQGSDVALIP